jgi:hypothetical protein
MASLAFIQASKLIDLLRSADKRGEMYVRVMSANRLALGADPMNPTTSIDLSKELVGPFAKSTAGVPEPEPQSSPKSARRSGDYWFEIKGKQKKVSSVRELLGEALRGMEAHSPGTLEKLSYIRPKKKRIVSRDKKALFDSEHLVDKFAEKLMNGWWYGVNNSTVETENWLKRACECAGLKWGESFRTSLSEPIKLTNKDLGWE